MNASAYVWIVSMGEYCQGGSVYGVFHKLPDAMTFVAQRFPEFKRDYEDQSNEHIAYYQDSDWLAIRSHQIQ